MNSKQPYVALADRSDGTQVGGSSSVARQVDRRAAVVMITATTTAACTRARAARALYTLQQGPRSTKRAPVDCHRVPTSAPPGRKDGFYLHHDVEDVCRSDRRAAGVGEESAQGARSCDLEGNRAGLAASSTSEMLCRSQWSRSGLSECNHVAVDGHHLMPV